MTPESSARVASGSITELPKLEDLVITLDGASSQWSSLDHLLRSMILHGLETLTLGTSHLDSTRHLKVLQGHLHALPRLKSVRIGYDSKPRNVDLWKSVEYLDLKEACNSSSIRV